ncbi:MAG: hypothetical protein HY010_15465 [Acidobacteria bacterium]|nr:hypothetical protein [Acidobacteriota bacterium]
MAAKKKRLTTLCIREGKSIRAASAILKQEGFAVGASKTRLGADLLAISREAPKAFERERQTAYGELKTLQKFVADADDMNSKETVDSLLAIRDRINRLLGLDAPQKSVVANVGLTPAYIEIAKAMADVAPEDRLKVLAYIRSLVKPLELTADCFPPTEVE